MAYYYQDPSHNVYAYEYSSNSNQDNNNEYEYEYESYTNHTEPDHIPSEPDYGQYNDIQHHINADYKDPTDQWETECEVHEHKAHEPKGFEHGGGKIYELGELRHEDRAIYREEYKLGELERDRDGIDECKELKREGEYESATLKYKTMEELAHEPEYSTLGYHISPTVSNNCLV